MISIQTFKNLRVLYGRLAQAIGIYVTLNVPKIGNRKSKKCTKPLQMFLGKKTWDQNGKDNHYQQISQYLRSFEVCGKFLALKN
ncbi:hypothetical protein Dsui_2084 [Azospira oryzae PS]|uniref:Uncharacterized protein n=1 Tax=Azospira oryzae (strain ATCC BAA-33 / DSM 13638 / PS) TaxID=640081 RepID=G8QJ37_AZOOP|nr:hypothetical protein Dsui_2084 [Azospira oryzae PS]